VRDPVGPAIASGRLLRPQRASSLATKDFEAPLRWQPPLVQVMRPLAGCRAKHVRPAGTRVVCHVCHKCAIGTRNREFQPPVELGAKEGVEKKGERRRKREKGKQKEKKREEGRRKKKHTR